MSNFEGVSEPQLQKYKTCVATKWDYAIQQAVDNRVQYLRTSPELYIGMMLDQMVFKLQTSVLKVEAPGECHTYTKNKNETKNVEFEIQHLGSWWDYFKYQYFPDWLLKRFPVAVITRTVQKEVEVVHTTTTNIDKPVIRVCPHLDVNQYQGQSVHFEYLATGAENRAKHHYGW